MLSVNLDKALHDLGNSAADRTDYQVFTCLTEYMNSEGVSTVSQNLIAEKTGFKRRTIFNSVKRLQEKGFLTIEKTLEDSQGVSRGIASNIYHIAPQYLMETEDAEPKSSTQYLAQRLRNQGVEMTVKHNVLSQCDNPEPQDIRHALDNRLVVWRYKNDRIQVLAQTLSNWLDTRTSSLLAVNKKQGVPAKYIHRLWKQTWVDLEGLKQRVAHTEHGSALLKNLKQVIQMLDEWECVDNASKESASTSCAQPSVKQKDTDMMLPGGYLWKARTSQLTSRVHDLEMATIQANSERARLRDSVRRLKKRVDDMEMADKWAVQAMREKHTPFDALSRRVSSMMTHTDRLDAKTDGLESRVSVLEDTSKWLSWSLATVLSLRFIGFTLHWLRRK